MKAFIVLSLVSVAFGLQPCANPAAPVQAAPFASPLPGGPVPFGGPAGPGGPAVPVNPALMAKMRPRVDQWSATLASGNGESHAALYTTDATIMPDGDFSYYGRVGARKWAVKNKAANLLSGPIQILDIKEGSGVTAVHGTMHDARGSGDVAMYWVDQNGQLLLQAMLYNWDTALPQFDAMGDMAVKKRVQTRMDEWSKLYEAKNTEGLSAMYTELSKVFPDDDFMYDGPEGARKVYQDNLDAGITKNTFMCAEAKQIQDTVTAWCYYREYKGADLVDEGTNLFVFQEVNGQLMIQYDIFNFEWVESNRTADVKLAQTYYDEWDALFTAGNIAGVVAKYEPDAVRMVSGGVTGYGPPAIQKQLQDDYNSGERYQYEVFTATRVGADMMYVTGRQQMLKDDIVSAEGNFADLFRIVGGKPKHLWDTYSIN